MDAPWQVHWTSDLPDGGMEPPEWLVSTLAQVYPTVHLGWSSDRCRWGLWDKDGDLVQLIGLITDEEGNYADPNMANTVERLNEIDVGGRLHNEYDIERYLDDLDRFGTDKDLNSEAYAKIAHANDQIHEGSERAYHAMTRPVVITPSIPGPEG